MEAKVEPKHKIIDCKGCRRKAQEDPSQMILDTAYDIYYGDTCPMCGWSPGKE